MKLNLSKTFRYVNAEGAEITFEYDYGFLINKPEGIDTVGVQITQAQGINQTGATIQSQNIQPRPVNITGKLVGKFSASNKQKLISTIRPDIPGKLYADDMYLDVIVTSTPVVSPEEKFARFAFSLLAPYPYWQSSGREESGLSGVEYGFKFPVNWSRGYKFGVVSEKEFIEIENRGQLPVPYTATFEAKDSVTNPKITLASTGQFVKIVRTMRPGEKIVVSITHSGVHVDSSEIGDIRGALTLDSKFFRIPTGKNLIRPDAELGKTNLGVTVAYSTEQVGVYV